MQIRGKKLPLRTSGLAGIVARLRQILEDQAPSVSLRLSE